MKAFHILTRNIRSFCIKMKTKNMYKVRIFSMPTPLDVPVRILPVSSKHSTPDQNYTTINVKERKQVTLVNNRNVKKRCEWKKREKEMWRRNVKKGSEGAMWSLEDNTICTFYIFLTLRKILANAIWARSQLYRSRAYFAWRKSSRH